MSAARTGSVDAAPNQNVSRCTFSQNYISHAASSRFRHIKDDMRNDALMTSGDCAKAHRISYDISFLFIFQRVSELLQPIRTSLCFFFLVFDGLSLRHADGCWAA